MQVRNIPVVSHEEFNLLVANDPNLIHGSPYIVQDYIRSWPKYRQWQDMGYLRKRFGDLQAFAKAPNFITNSNAKLVSAQTSFDQYMDYIQRPSAVEEIYAGCWLEGDYEQLLKLDLPLYCGTLRIVHHAQDPVFAEVNPLLPRSLCSWNHALPYYYSLFNHFWLLVSLPGALTPLHTDNNGTIAIIAQLSGKKRATLFSPRDLQHVRTPDVGFLDPENPDETDFPTWKQAVRWEGEIEEGQVLFVGTDWAHHVRTLETSISVSFDYVDRSNLAAYARSTGWAAALGNRAKKRPDFFYERMNGRVSRDAISAHSAATVGRELMLQVLQSQSSLAGKPEMADIRELYATHLGELLETA